MTTETADLEQQLARYRDLTDRALLQQLPSREPRRYLYDLVTSSLSHVGKGLRPALCIATCRAFGGSIEQALPSAVSIELLHNAFLVHDDIEDGSLYRRNEAAMYVEEGLPIAINAGCVVTPRSTDANRGSASRRDFSCSRSASAAFLTRPGSVQPTPDQ